MRKFAGVLLRGSDHGARRFVRHQPVAAAATPTCKALAGTATFSPAVPKIGSTTKVKTTVGIKGAKLSGCTGGGVTGGTVNATLKFGLAANCASLLKGASTKTAGVVTIIWNTKKTSTAKATLVGITGKPTPQTVSGTITAGLFKGKTVSVVTSTRRRVDAPRAAHEGSVLDPQGQDAHRQVRRTLRSATRRIRAAGRFAFRARRFASWAWWTLELPAGKPLGCRPVIEAAKQLQA